MYKSFLLLLLSACHENTSCPQHLLFSTTHFEYYDDEQESEALWCSGLSEWMEYHYQVNTDFLDAPLPGDARIRYYHYPEDVPIEDPCPDKYGCYQGYDVHTYNVLNSHELVHAYAWTLGDAPEFFQEGIAEVLGGESDGDSIVNHDAPLPDMLSDEQRKNNNIDLDYAVAGSFTRFLLDRFERERYVTFYRGLQKEYTYEDISNLFLDVFDVPIETVITDWQLAPEEYRGDNYLELAPCGLPTIVIGNGTSDSLPLESANCGQSVLSSTEPTGFIGEWRRITISDDTSLRIRASSIFPNQIELNGCGFWLKGTNRVSTDSGSCELWREAIPGDYTVQVLTEGQDATSSLLASGEQGIVAWSCDDAQVFNVDGSLSSLRVVIDSGEAGADIYSRLYVPESITITVTFSGADMEQTPSSIQLCTGECNDLSCSRVVAGLFGDPSFEIPPDSIVTLSYQRELGQEAATLSLEFIRE